MGRSCVEKKKKKDFANFLPRGLIRSVIKEILTGAKSVLNCPLSFIIGGQ